MPINDNQLNSHRKLINTEMVGIDSEKEDPFEQTKSSLKNDKREIKTAILDK